MAKAPNKVNVGHRTPAEDAEALAQREAEASQVVEEDGAKYAVSTAFGMTVKTRIA